MMRKARTRSNAIYAVTHAASATYKTWEDPGESATVMKHGIPAITYITFKPFGL